MVELCACGHANDHRGSRCGKPVELEGGTTAICPCQSGLRVDVVTLQVLTEISMWLRRANTTLTRILAVAETASGLQSRIITDKESGAQSVDVQPRQVTPQIIVPR